MSNSLIDIVNLYLMSPDGSPMRTQIEHIYIEQDYCSLHLALLATSYDTRYQHLRHPSALKLMLRQLQTQYMDDCTYSHIDTLLDVVQFLTGDEKQEFEKVIIQYRDYFSQCILLAMGQSAEGWLSSIYDFIQKNERVTMSFLMHHEITRLIKEELHIVHNDGEDWTEFEEYPLFSVWFNLRPPVTEEEQKWLLHHQFLGYDENYDIAKEAMSISETPLFV